MSDSGKQLKKVKGIGKIGSMGNVGKFEIGKYQEKNRKWKNVTYENLEKNSFFLVDL